jgi:hypothetical protein
LGEIHGIININIKEASWVLKIMKIYLLLEKKMKM